MTSKTCSKCGIEKDVGEFYKERGGMYGVRSKCKNCIKKYYEENKEFNKESRKEYQKEWTKNNRILKNTRAKQYRETHKEIRRAWTEKNKEAIKEKARNYQKQLRRTNFRYVMITGLRCRFNQAIKSYSKNGKTKSCSEYGIDFDAIHNHIGPRPDSSYHLDHIIPISVFNLDIPEQVRLAHIPQNLRWILKTENLKKKDFVDWELIFSIPELVDIAKTIGLFEKYEKEVAQNEKTNRISFPS